MSIVFVMYNFCYIKITTLLKFEKLAKNKTKQIKKAKTRNINNEKSNKNRM